MSVTFTTNPLLTRAQRVSRADTPDELKVVLARAFDRAWARYYGQGQGILSPDFARTALAKRLVQMAKDGVTDEESLTAGGLWYLDSISLDELGNLA
jgi:hypothetical protein